MKRNKNGRAEAAAVAFLMTAGLLLLLLASYLIYERPRTLKHALEVVEGAPLSFSRESGFFEEGFVLEILPDSRIPQGDGIEVRYTWDGSEPDSDSPLYGAEGIDLSLIAAQLLEASDEEEEQRAAAIAEALEKKALEEQSAAGQTVGQSDKEQASEEQSAGQSDKKQASEEQSAGQSDKKQASEEQSAGQSDKKQASVKQSAGEDSPEKQSGSGKVSAEQASEEISLPTLEEGRAAWEREKWLSASDAGLYPERKRDGICVIPLRARLIQGSDRSRVVTMTYVIGPGVQERFRDVFVASVVTDPWNLFDYDYGFMVSGSHYESDVKKGVRADRAGNAYQKGDEWVRDGHVTLFSPGGAVVLEEDAGLSISGYSSRGLPTKSFRAEAMPEHGSSGSFFSLDIFSGEEAPKEAAEADDRAASALREKGDGLSAAAASAAAVPEETGSEEDRDGQKKAAVKGQKKTSASVESVSGTVPDASGIRLFKKVKFRTHGVPNYHIRCVRNQYAKILADESGFPGLTENRLGVMFLNGGFYTVCDITPSADKDYICRLFSLNVPDAVEKYSGSDVDVYTKSKILKLFTSDLTDPACRERLEEAVDMDNYLSYFALEVLFNNADWPFNNVTIWRYLGENDPSNPYTDGRIRFLLDDMDQILTNGLHGDPSRWSSELIDYMMKDKGSTFHHVMECKEYRDTFLTRVDDLLASSFEPSHASAVLDGLYGALRREYLLDYGEGFWAEMEDTAKTTRANIFEKEALYRADIEKYMGLSERYPVRIEAGEGVTVVWKGMAVDGGSVWTNDYYRGTAFSIRAEVEEGYRFLGFQVNGKKLDQEKTSLEISDALLDGEEILTIRADAEILSGKEGEK